MYITPNSTIRVLHNINLDADYINTLTFANVTAQATYFSNNTKYTFPAQTYQRVNKNVVRVNRKADDMYDCSYLMFQNTSYGNKWFYAFIDRVEYVNDVTSNIYYHIDKIQTWLKDWTFMPCFVERMHTETDLVGGNIIPEPLDTGEMVFNDYRVYGELLPMAIIILIADMDVDDDKHGQLIDNCYSGCRALMYHVNDTGIDTCNRRIESYNQSRPDAIVGIYMLPAVLLGRFEDDHEIAFSNQGYSDTLTLTGITESDTLDGYNPRNKKLLTYPFNYLNIDNASGQSLSLRYEFFPSRIPQLKINACRTQPVTITLEPYNYKSTDREGVEHTLHTEILTLNGYPMCSWTMDSWKAWVAQNTLPLLADTSVSWAKTAVGAGIAGSAVSLPNLALEKSVADTSEIVQGKTNAISQGGLSATGSILSQVSRSAIQADVCRGNVNSGNVKLASNKQSFFYGRISVNYQTASVIDSFFDKYGYAINRIITPNIMSRPQWNYLKTIECTIRGNIPSDDKKDICDIINRGITFWHNPANLGDYSQPNAPT